MPIFQPRHRRETRAISGVVVGSVKNSATITAGSIWTYNIEDQKTTWVKYLPFDRIVVVNNADEDISLYPNMDTGRAKLIPSGTIWVFEAPEDIPAIHSWKIKNEHASTTVSANEIEIQCSRKGMVSDSLAKAISKNVFMRALLGL